MRKNLKIGSLFLCLFALLACDSNKETVVNPDNKDNSSTEKQDNSNSTTDTNNNSNNNDSNNNGNGNTSNNGDNNNTNTNNNDDEPFVDMLLSNKNGMVVKFASKGAKIDSITYDDIKIGENGFVAGRVANRIANATFELDGVTYNVNKNNGKHCLHGGAQGFGEINWTKKSQTAHKIVFELNSPDGDQGFPGNLHMTTTYTLSDDGSLDIEYGAYSDKKTIFNPTNHLYLNLNGVDTRTWRNHELWLSSNQYTKADNELIPTGEIVSTSGTNLDYYQNKKDYVGNNDSNIVISEYGYKINRKVAELTGTTTGITCEVITDRPGLQLYNDNGHICLEAQDFPDAIHHSNFPSIILNANDDYHSKTTYKFTRENTTNSTNLNLVHRAINNNVRMDLESDFVSNTSVKALEKLNPLLRNSNKKDYVLSPASMLLCYAGLSAVSSNLNDEEFGIANAANDVKKMLNAWNFEANNTSFKSTVMHQQVGSRYAFDTNKRQSIADKYIATMVSDFETYKDDANSFFENEMGMNISVPDLDISDDSIVTYGALKMKDYVENGLNCKNKSFNYETGNKDTISYVFATEDWPTEHLYYKGSNYSVLKQSIAYTQLLIVLPDENVDINDVNVAEAYQKFMEEKANVRAYGYIPLFHNHSENVNLTELFRSSFDGNEILMDKLLKDDVVNDLILNQVLQTSDFELNEYGVCGESITAAWSAGAAMPQGELIEFNVDKPFYAISLYDNFPLFVNKVNNPGK